jgi:hypothetical protein
MEVASSSDASGCTLTAEMRHSGTGVRHKLAPPVAFRQDRHSLTFMDMAQGC